MTLEDRQVAFAETIGRDIKQITMFDRNDANALYHFNKQSTRDEFNFVPSEGDLSWDTVKKQLHTRTFYTGTSKRLFKLKKDKVYKVTLKVTIEATNDTRGVYFLLGITHGNENKQSSLRANNTIQNTSTYKKFLYVPAAEKTEEYTVYIIPDSSLLFKTTLERNRTTSIAGVSNTNAKEELFSIFCHISARDRRRIVIENLAISEIDIEAVIPPKKQFETKQFTANIPARFTAGTNDYSFPHGLDGSKIQQVSVSIKHKTKDEWLPPNTFLYQYEYHMYWDSNNVILRIDEYSGQELVNQPVNFFITYKV